MSSELMVGVGLCEGMSPTVPGKLRVHLPGVTISLTDPVSVSVSELEELSEVIAGRPFCLQNVWSQHWNDPLFWHWHL